MNFQELQATVAHGFDRSNDQWQTIFYQHDLTEVSDSEITAYRKLLRQRFGCPSWVTKDHRVIPMDLMKPSHLANAFKAKTKQIWNLYKQSCQYRSHDDRNALLYADALKAKEAVKSICVAQHRQGYEPTDDDLKRLKAMEDTLYHWFPGPSMEGF